MVVVVVDTTLVEDGEHLVQPVIDFSMQTGNLYNNTVVVQAVYKLVRDAPNNGFFLVVKHLTTNVNYGVFNIAHIVTQQVDGHHRQSMAVGAVSHDVLWILVVYTQILAEAQGLRRQPGLL